MITGSDHFQTQMKLLYVFLIIYNDWFYQSTFYLQNHKHASTAYVLFYKKKTGHILNSSEFQLKCHDTDENYFNQPTDTHTSGSCEVVQAHFNSEPLIENLTDAKASLISSIDANTLSKNTDSTNSGTQGSSVSTQGSGLICGETCSDVMKSKMFIWLLIICMYVYVA